MKRPETLRYAAADRPSDRTIGSVMPKTASRNPRNHTNTGRHRRHTESDPRRHTHALDRAIGIARAQVLSGDRRRGAHQPDGRPGDQREQLRVADGVGRLRRGALLQRSDEAQQQHTADVHRDALHARGQTEAEQRPDDREVRRRLMPRSKWITDSGRDRRQIP